MRTVAFLFQYEAFCLQHEGKADNLWVVLLKQCVCLHEHTQTHARTLGHTHRQTPHTYNDNNIMVMMRKKCDFKCNSKIFYYYYHYLENGSIGKLKRIFLKSCPKLREWGEGWKESGKKRPKRMKRKTCKKKKKMLNQRVENRKIRHKIPAQTWAEASDESLNLLLWLQHSPAH